MKPFNLVLSFLPLVAFSVLARLLPHSDIGVAGLIGAAFAIVAMLAVRPAWPPKILTTCQFVIFAVVAIIGFTRSAGTDRWLATWAAAGVGLVMGLVILILIPAVPFTEQFARLSTPQAYWTSPTFKQINRVLSTGWGIALLGVGASRLVAVAINGHTTRRLPELIFGLAIPAVMLMYMLKFSRTYPDRVTHESAAQAPAAR
jgi:predicted anti-sigma-YlaC factor YlaD